MTLDLYVEYSYMPWAAKNRAPASHYTYRQLWARWRPLIGNIEMDALTTSTLTEGLTRFAELGYSGHTLSHQKWFISAIYEFAIATGTAKSNPAPASKWLRRIPRAAPQPEYSLDHVLKILFTLEPLNLQAACAVALCYFGALRPCEARGLRVEDYNPEASELHVCRSVWTRFVGDTKTAESVGTVPVVQPLKGLLDRLARQAGSGYLLQNSRGMPLDLNALNFRFIRPTLRALGIEWHGYYPGRRGISSLVTDTSKNALNSTGLLRHSNPATALKYYTRPQKQSVRAALEHVEKLALKR